MSQAMNVTHLLLYLTGTRKAKKNLCFTILGLFCLALLLSLDVHTDDENVQQGKLEVGSYEESQEPCETIDIVIICKDYNVSKDVATLTKSLLFHRKNPIHLHFLADNIATKILSVLFDTWDVPHLEFSFHTTENVEQPYGVYSMVKLLLPQILPASIEKVIVLDTHITMSMDVASLWNLISTFSNDQVIGLVENQDNWNSEEAISDSVTVLRKGFNTDVMALDLKKLRKINGLWRSDAHKYIAKNYDVNLTEQDVINAVVFNNPHIVHQLPCMYNIQLSGHTQSEICSSKLKTTMMIINWNSPSRQNVIHKHSGFFRDVYNSFVQLDGNLLRRTQVFCKTVHTFITEDSRDANNFCSELNEVQKAKYRTHLSYFPYAVNTDEVFDVTWVSQMSFDRIQMIEPLLRSWEGPISLALYFSDAEVELFHSFILHSDYLRSRTNIGYHIVFKQGSHYPINLLRNVALDQVLTPFVFLSDIDFLPGSEVYKNLKWAVEDLQVGNENKALVIPAFNYLKHSIKQIKSKEELISLLDDGYLSSFGESFPPGHLPTNFTYWREANNPYQIKWAPLFEPYIVVRQNVTRYDTRFAGYGWNKIAHSLELRAQNYKFIVLSDCFIVHQPHSRGIDNLKYRSSLAYRRCCDPLKYEFAQKLMSLYQYQVDKVALEREC